MIKLWIVMQYRREKEHFEFQGIFDSKEKAIDACCNDLYVIFSGNLNEQLSDESLGEKPSWYPKATWDTEPEWD
jgi:hypothetical protein